MIILPAIDLYDGQVVRLRQGRLEDKHVYSDDPLKFARCWEEEGGNCLHVVDLNAAFTGEQKNLHIIKRLVATLNIPVQVGGGVRSLDAAAALLEAGATRVVAGTKAVQDPDFVSALVEKFGGDRIGVSVDARDGKVAVKGWAETTSIHALDFVRKIEQQGASTIIFTDIATDGMMSGPNLPLLIEVLKLFRGQVISSGGVADMEDIRLLASLPGLYGVIIGKALFDEAIDLGEAVAAAAVAAAARGAVG
ncbi:MAG: 1-(5-phosphoribosyl)-5-[(5-phosphoribosylamino)methylideneamino]imidazole-4-carboxamide isomerase [Verrucomicrobia bacterium]|nr:1-(5-phosphoribosyl)-5-[(5-phosphoribosylamino)methylideneamino]imidazole-4-carboxamide isomerase [Verrucomicrobiota bacterium]